MSGPTTGGCFCGAVRYAISGEPELQLFCFCRDCLATSGTDGYAGMMVSTADFRVTAGEPTVHARSSQAGRTVRRHFCGTCGSALWGETELGLVSVAAGSLDDPNVFQPSTAVFADDAPHWARVPDALQDA